MSRKEEKKERMNFSFFPTVEKCSKIPFRPSSGYSPLFLSQEKKKKENSVLFPPPFSVAFPFLSFFHNASTSIRNNRSHPSSSSSSPALPSSYTTKLGFVSIRRSPPCLSYVGTFRTSPGRPRSSLPSPGRTRSRQPCRRHPRAGRHPHQPRWT